MPTLFVIETDRVFLSWGGPQTIEMHGTATVPGCLRMTLHRSDAVFGTNTWRAAVPSEVAADPTIAIGPQLFEEISYNILLQSRTTQEVRLVHRDPTILSGLVRMDHGRTVYGSLNFGGQVGRSRFRVLAGGQPELDFEVEVFPTKLDYTTDYEQLIADVQDILAGLVLEYLRSTFHMGVEVETESSTRLEWLALLRHLIGDLERGLTYVAKHPHRAVMRQRVLTRAERLRRPDPTLLKAIVQGRAKGPRVLTDRGLPLNSMLPERCVLLSLDTPEHRWLSLQLTRIRRCLAEIRREEEMRIAAHSSPSPTRREARSLREIADLETRIARLQELEPVAEAGGPPPPGFSSLQLQAAPGYREAYRSCLLLLLGLRVDGGPVGLSLKDIHLLYEYWCYLSLLKMVADITEVSFPVERLIKIEQYGLRLALRKGHFQTVTFDAQNGRTVEVSYSPQFGGDEYLLAQVPDIVLTLRSPGWPAVRLVLDAKYRLDSSKDYVSRLGSPGPPADSINVLHRYRDAILERSRREGPRSQTLKRTVIEGAALFPYVDFNGEFKNSRLLESLERLGIGALPFLPTETRYVEEWLRRMLRQTGWSTAERAVPDGSYEQMRFWQEAAKEVVLVGALRSRAQEHLDWICQERCYYTPLTPTQRRQFAVRWVALYSPTTLRTPGAVTHVAPVGRIEVRSRADIRTPWRAGRPRSEQQVVYTLGEVTELARPIENRPDGGRPERFSRNRWGSRLSLMRAHELRELFLETEPEWRLYEELSVANLPFRIEPGPARLQDEEDPRGRAWFRLTRASIQYRGKAGFVVRCPPHPDEYVPDVARVLSRLLRIPLI